MRKQQKHQQQPPQFAGNDDLLPAAPPAFPQPVSSLPSSAMQQYLSHPSAAAYVAGGAGAYPLGHEQQLQYPAGILPISSRAYSSSLQPSQQQQQQGPYWGRTTAAGPYSNGTGALQQPAPGAAAAAGNAVPYGYAVTGVPYSSAMAQYAVYEGGAYGDASVPLLTDANGFMSDMVFANRQVRHAFLRKVLGLMTVQLLLTAVIAAPVFMHKTVRHFLHANPWVFGLSVILTTTVLLIMAWSETARRKFPTNLLLLLLFTVANGLLVGVASATYSKQVLLLGVLIAATVSLALIAYASQTSVDFSASGGILYSALVILLAVTLADWFLGFKTLHLLIGGCGALLFSAYLVYDVQLLASGESCYQVSPDEYVFAAINVYTDVITLFMYILQVLTQLQSRGDEE